MDLLSENKPNNIELCSVLNKLILSWESEVVEFKEAGKDYDRNKIGQYFSAISNESNLKGLQHGWFSVLEIKIGQLLGRIIEITKDWTHLNRKLQ